MGGGGGGARWSVGTCLECPEERERKERVVLLMREQENNEKGYFFRPGQCTALSSFRVGKVLFL